MDKFWPLSHFGNNSIKNESIDVALKGCFENYDTTACVRNTLLSFFGLGTLFLCIIRIIRLHYLHHPQIHQYLIFYLASFEILFLFLKWIALTAVYQLEFAAFYFKFLQFILLCHFHWSLVSRILHRERITWIIMPILCVFFGFLTIISVLAMVSYLSTWNDCLAPHWLLLSILESLGLQLYVIAGVYITRKINSVSALSSFKWEQKRDLWSVIAIYAISAYTSLIYYSTLQYLGNFETGCSGVFYHMQVIYSPVYAMVMIIKFLLPIWVMLSIFYPTKGCVSSEEERLLGFSHSGSTTSVFNQSAHYQNSYKQLTLPVENWFDECPPLRRSASSPALFVRPTLSPISEEDALLPPPRIHYDSYGATDMFQYKTEAVMHPTSSRVYSCYESGWLPPSRNHHVQKKILVSLNQCSDEIENVTPSSGERA